MAIAAARWHTHNNTSACAQRAIDIGISNDVRGSNTIPTGVLSRCRGELETSVNSTTQLNQVFKREHPAAAAWRSTRSSLELAAVPWWRYLSSFVHHHAHAR